MARHKKPKPDTRAPRGAPQPVAIRDADGRVTRYAVDVELPRTPGGTRRRKRVYGRTEAEAVQKARKVMVERDEGTLVEASADTLRGYADWWLETVKAPKVTPETLRHYRGLLVKHAYPALGDRRLNGISTEQLQTLLLRVYAGSPASVEDLAIVLRQVFGYALRAKPRKITENPMDAVEVPRHESRPPRPMTEAELHTFIKAIEGHAYEGAFWLSLCGLRPAEVCGAQWGDIDWTAEPYGAIRVRQQAKRRDGATVLHNRLKTPSSRRVVYLLPQAADALKRQQARDYAAQLESGRRSQQVLTPPRAAVMSPSTYWRAFKAVCTAAGLDADAYHLHDLRHTYATLAMSAGVPLSDLQAQMGHTDPAMTRKYSHPTDDGQRDAARRLGRKLGGE